MLVEFEKFIPFFFFCYCIFLLECLYLVLFLQECPLYPTTCSFCTTSCVCSLPCANSSPYPFLKTGLFTETVEDVIKIAGFVLVPILPFFLLIAANFEASCCFHVTASHWKGSGMPLTFSYSRKVCQFVAVAPFGINLFFSPAGIHCWWANRRWVVSYAGWRDWLWVC